MNYFAMGIRNGFGIDISICHDPLVWDDGLIDFNGFVVLLPFFEIYIGTVEEIPDDE